MSEDDAEFLYWDRYEGGDVCHSACRVGRVVELLANSFPFRARPAFDAVALGCLNSAAIVVDVQYDFYDRDFFVPLKF